MTVAEMVLKTVLAVVLVLAALYFLPLMVLMSSDF